MLPPMAYRLVNADADHEQAYILACQLVLPAGMLGLMIAAMCSATASMVTTQLNVFAGAFTTEFYRGLLRPGASERELVLAGRLFTIFLGGIAMAGALLIPLLGTYTGYILASVSMLTGPLVLPSIWSLFSRKIGLGTAWTVTAVSITVGLLIKFGFGAGGWFAAVAWLEPLNSLAQRNARLTEIAVGTILPLGLLAISEFSIRHTNHGWERIMNHRMLHRGRRPSLPSLLPARLCGYATCLVGAMLVALAIVNDQDTLITGTTAAILFAAGAAILLAAHHFQRKSKRQSGPRTTYRA
jgi:Na+/proline symporter